VAGEAGLSTARTNQVSELLDTRKQKVIGGVIFIKGTAKKATGDMETVLPPD